MCWISPGDHCRERQRRAIMGSRSAVCFRPVLKASVATTAPSSTSATWAWRLVVSRASARRGTANGSALRCRAIAWPSADPCPPFHGRLLDPPVTNPTTHTNSPAPSTTSRERASRQSDASIPPTAGGGAEGAGAGSAATRAKGLIAKLPRPPAPAEGAGARIATSGSCRARCRAARRNARFGSLWSRSRNSLLSVTCRSSAASSCFNRSRSSRTSLVSSAAGTRQQQATSPSPKASRGSAQTPPLRASGESVCMRGIGSKARGRVWLATGRLHALSARKDRALEVAFGWRALKPRGVATRVRSVLRHLVSSRGDALERSGQSPDRLQARFHLLLIV